MSSRPARGTARLAAILDALPDALVLVNGNGTVVNANSIAQETLESAGAPLVGRGLLDILPDFDPRRIPGSMRPEELDSQGRTGPTRMTALRTDGSDLQVEVTSAAIPAGHSPYASAIEAAFADDYSGDELLMLVVRDLTGTLDTEAELARQQRQTEMILRAATEGVIGVDTEGRVVLVNPAAAQTLGHRAGALGGQEVHALIHHSHADGSPLAWEETPLHDTLRSGRKHRVRQGQVLWHKSGEAIPVDMTTAPVRDGDQLVGAVMTFTDRRPHDSLVARHSQLDAVLAHALRGPLEELRGELSALAADAAGQLWPEANQVLHHLAAGYARMTTLVDNVLSFQRLDSGREKLARKKVSLDSVVTAGVEGATELIGPGRAQFAVHAPPIDAEVDPERLAQALAHLVADVAGVDSTGRSANGARGDSTIVVAAAQRGDVVRIEVRGPYTGGDPVHSPLVRGIVRLHGGVLQTHEVPGAADGRAYVLEVPVHADRKPVAPGRPNERTGETTVVPVPAEPVRGTASRRAAEQASRQGPQQDGPGEGRATALPALPAGSDAPRQEPVIVATPEQSAGGFPVAPQGGDSYGEAAPARPQLPAQTSEEPRPVAEPVPGPQIPGQAAPQQQVAVVGGGETPTGRRRRARAEGPVAEPHPGEATALPAPQGYELPETPPTAGDTGGGRRRRAGGAAEPEHPAEAAQQIPQQAAGEQQPSGRRRRAAPEGVPSGVHGPDTAAGPSGGIVMPPPEELPPPPVDPYAAAPALAGVPAETPEETGQPVPPGAAPQPVEEAGVAGAEPAVQPGPEQSAPAGGFAVSPEGVAHSEAQQPAPPHGGPGGAPETAAPQEPVAAEAPPAQSSAEAELPARSDHSRVAASPILSGSLPQQERPRQQPLPMPGSARSADPHSSGVSVQTLGQGIPVSQVTQHEEQRAAEQRAAEQQAAAGAAGPMMGAVPASSPGRRRKLGNPAADDARMTAAAAVPSAPGTDGVGRQFAIGAPAEGSEEGPEHLDGPGGAVEVTAARTPADDAELPPEPLDNPRRLLVWPEPDVSTQQALTERGYRPVLVQSRQEVDAQIAAYPAALFVDPLTGPITRTALQSLRQAAVAAGVPVLVTAGLGLASRDAAYGADPAVLLKALAPRDSEQHPPRVLLVEERQPIADALSMALERRGMQVVHAAADAEAMEAAQQFRPNLVVMDLGQVRRRRVGLIDFLRVHDALARTPFVVYTAAELDPARLPQLASGETVLFLAERSTSDEVQARIVDLLAKIGAGSLHG
ncbi:PAS domain-containing protein [Streptomyces bohaiensis]|uniref:histidine kinase n=1 Tax=Streptomyces bohaiensis TaxID=1431344 RepID=A0ABX1C8B8_9ACTN|nr:PAS domain-containing protein [Streptomyces bohaiensis]NJQ15308.1 PAS domain-containing protein [Streptomyces bohaiensis]